MKVKATAQGYLDGLREMGDEFDVPDGFSAPWFYPIDLTPQKVDDKEPEAVKVLDASSAGKRPKFQMPTK